MLGSSCWTGSSCWAGSGSSRIGAGAGLPVLGSFLLNIGIDGVHFFFFLSVGGAGDAHAGSSSVVSLGRVPGGDGSLVVMSRGGGWRERGGEMG